MSEDLVLRREHGSVLELRLNRSEKRNALSPELFTALGAALGTLGDPYRAAVLSAEGPIFCAGIDLNALAAIGGIEDGGPEAMQAALMALEEAPIPTVCAIRGAALGAGLEMILGADFRVAAEDAVFAFPEIDFGIVCDLGGIHRAVRLAGLAAARDLVLTGRRISAGEAQRMGLVDRVVPAPEVEASALELAQTLAAKAPLAVAVDRRLLLEATRDSSSECLARALAEQIPLVRSADFAEAISAHFARRAPSFTGS